MSTKPADTAERPPRKYAAAPELRRKAKAIRKRHGYYDAESEHYGRLTNPMLLDLSPLLHEPIDPRYIKTEQPVKGKPYESTGITSVQVQMNRLNAILGEPHWTTLQHYEEGGTVCNVHLLVGNDLGPCKLDDHGVLDAGHAEVLARRSGKGGHQQGSTRGDLFKGSETNASKRVIARIGPGSEVYCLDFDEDKNPISEEYALTSAAAVAPTTVVPQASASAAEDPEAALAALLGTEDELTLLRRETDMGMAIFGLQPADRLQRLQANSSQDKLEGLRDRINLALEERDAGDGEIHG